jgi:hypothetical protein
LPSTRAFSLLRIAVQKPKQISDLLLSSSYAKHGLVVVGVCVIRPALADIDLVTGYLTTTPAEFSIACQNVAAEGFNHAK